MVGLWISLQSGCTGRGGKHWSVPVSNSGFLWSFYKVWGEVIGNDVGGTGGGSFFDIHKGFDKWHRDTICMLATNQMGWKETNFSSCLIWVKTPGVLVSRVKVFYILNGGISLSTSDNCFSNGCAPSILQWPNLCHILNGGWKFKWSVKLNLSERKLLWGSSWCKQGCQLVQKTPKSWRESVTHSACPCVKLGTTNEGSGAEKLGELDPEDWMVKQLMQLSTESGAGVILLVLLSTWTSLEMSSESRPWNDVSGTLEDVGHGSVCVYVWGGSNWNIWKL